jgi:hypothetical protein
MPSGGRSHRFAKAGRPAFASAPSGLTTDRKGLRLGKVAAPGKLFSWLVSRRPTRRTPGPPPSECMNLTPAASIAVRIFSMVVRAHNRTGRQGCPELGPPSGDPLDGCDAGRHRREQRRAVRTKFMLPWSFSEEAAAEKHTWLNSSTTCGSPMLGPRCSQLSPGAASGSRSRYQLIRSINISF